MNFAKTILVLSLTAFVTAASEKPRDLDTPRTFPKIESKADWEKRAERIREHALVSCGLWPLPAKTPLNAKVFGRVERDGYSVEKVYLETYPGFFLGGNLYRPLGKGNGPFPAILNPHGHWDNGRMADSTNGSIAARCISFARQGMIAFSYDMAGYNDTKQIRHRAFATNPTNLLWSISLMGLQTWDSIRALDFLESLRDVDKTRLACTGESGGGTQTFMLGAVDSRLAAQAPVVMVSHSMQGGCLCENAPGLRVDYSNMEFAAAPAPRPQIIVGATGDWTKTTMTVEGPSIERVYELLGHKDQFQYVIFDYGHNYNQTSREAVYEWFGKWFLNENDASRLKERPYRKEPDADLLAFADGSLPPRALSEDALTASLVALSRKQLEDARPRDVKSLAKWKSKWRTAWEHDLQLGEVRLARSEEQPESQEGGRKIRLERQPGNSQITIRAIEPAGKDLNVVAVLVEEETGRNASASPLADRLSAGGLRVLRVEQSPVTGSSDQFSKFYSTYNRTAVQNRVADLKAVADYATEKYSNCRVILIGQGGSGLSCLMAAPLAAGVAADCAGLDDSKDENLIAPEIFFPGLRRIGSANGIAALAAPNPLLLHNTAGKLDLHWLDGVYSGKYGKAFRKSDEPVSEDEIARWVLQVARR